ASITSFSAIQQLAVSEGNPPAYGLCSDNGSLSGVAVGGNGLASMQIKVTRTSGGGPQWTGTLSSGQNESEWISNVTCAVPGPKVGAAGNLGDPEDVPVTVAVGTDLTKPAATFSATVKVGPAPSE